MALKKTTKDFIAEKKEDTLHRIDTDIYHLDMQMAELSRQKTALKNRRAEISLLPFKEGDKVTCEITQGRSKKSVWCHIEIEDGIVYVRPYKNDGELSGRHFSVYPVNGDYSTVFNTTDVSSGTVIEQR